ncbi:hypothetical protein JCM18549_12140 [Halolamina salina]
MLDADCGDDRFTLVLLRERVQVTRHHGVAVSNHGLELIRDALFRYLAPPANRRKIQFAVRRARQLLRRVKVPEFGKRLGVDFREVRRALVLSCVDPGE